MPAPEKKHLHPRSKHLERYDFKALIESSPGLAAFIATNKYGNESVDFSNPEAVEALNKALLAHFYNAPHWELPNGYLCPAVPGRADYIHYAADILKASNNGKIPKGKKIRVLDIGVGANCVYPIIGHREYAWSFVGTDIDPISIKSANKNIAENPKLNQAISCRLQADPTKILQGVVQADEYFDLTVCNPPFYNSQKEAAAASQRKWQNLGLKSQKGFRNFGGQGNELWCPGGETAFIQKLLLESKLIKNQCYWFTTLVSQKMKLDDLLRKAKDIGATQTKTIAMAQGQKTSQILAWTFLNEQQQKAWKEFRWK